MTPTLQRPDRTARQPFPRVRLGAAAAAIALVLTACGSGDDASTDDGSAGASDASTTTVEPADNVADSQSDPETDTTDDAGEPSEEASASGDDDTPCSAVLGAEEFETLMGRTAEFSGAPTNCTVVFADDSVGQMSVFSGNRGADVSDELITKYTDLIENDVFYQENGVLLDGGRGYILLGDAGPSVAVLGDSGNFYQVNIPENAGVENVEDVLQAIAELLLTR